MSEAESAESVRGKRKGVEVDAFRWVSKWPTALASVTVLRTPMPGRRDDAIRRAHRGEPGATHLSPPAMSVGAVLGRKATNQTGSCHPSIALICELTGLAYRTVQRALRELRLAGVIKQRKRANRSSVYTLQPIGPNLSVLAGGAAGGVSVPGDGGAAGGASVPDGGAASGASGDAAGGARDYVTDLLPTRPPNNPSSPVVCAAPSRAHTRRKKKKRKPENQLTLGGDGW